MGYLTRCKFCSAPYLNEKGEAVTDLLNEYSGLTLRISWFTIVGTSDAPLISEGAAITLAEKAEQFRFHVCDDDQMSLVRGSTRIPLQNDHRLSNAPAAH